VKDKKIQVKDEKVIVSGLLSSNLPLGPGASPEQLEEFKTMLGKFNDARGNTIIYKFSKEENKRIKELYSSMNKEQRIQFPLLMFSKPRPKKSPTSADLVRWSNPKMYGVWLDDKRIDNAELANYKPEDFVLYDESRLSKNAVNYGKHYVQVGVYTPAKYDAMYKDGEETLYILKMHNVKVTAKSK
jgi:hypothetical protein